MIRRLIALAAVLGVMVVAPAVAFATCPGGEMNWPQCNLPASTTTMAPVSPSTTEAVPSSSVAPSSTVAVDIPSSFPNESPAQIPPASAPAYVPHPLSQSCLLIPYESGATIPSGEWHFTNPGEPFDGTAWINGMYCARNVTQIVPETSSPALPESPGRLPATGAEADIARFALGMLIAGVLVLATTKLPKRWGNRS